MLKLGIDGITLLAVSIMFAVCGSISSMSYRFSDASKCRKSQTYSMIAAIVAFVMSVGFFIFAVLNMN